MDKSCKNITYRCYEHNAKKDDKRSITVYGLDTEAYDSGKCFLICTSEGEAWKYNEFPRCLFSRKYRNANFVCYNLKYDESALLQWLDNKQLRELWEKDVVIIGDIKVKIIPHKCLTISKKGHSVTFYDMYNFYQGSLNYNTKKYLGKEKLDIETKTFTQQFVYDNYNKIVNYCIQDAVLVKELADLIIHKFEDFGVYPKKLYSTAYISYTYFRKNTNYETVQDLWQKDKKLLDYALASYNGGKFEVTEKGTGYLYEYDIVSAYPYEIANLVSLRHSHIYWDTKYHRYAVYGFLNVKMKIRPETYSSIAIKYNNTCIYATGHIEKIITKIEYEYLIECGADITIIDAVWIHTDHKVFPYKKEVQKLVKLKKEYKKDNKELDYHTIKIFLNSLYGKFVQLIETPTGYRASSCWNPIYASIITSNCRVRISRMQRDYPDIIAVHTDSIISKNKLNIGTGKELGDMDFETEGKGLVLGCGVYQIGDKIRFRGFQFDKDLFELFDTKRKTIQVPQLHVNTWREVAFHNWDIEKINLFENNIRDITCDFDMKRVWLEDYKRFDEVLKRNVNSLSRYNFSFG